MFNALKLIYKYIHIQMFNKKVFNNFYKNLIVSELTAVKILEYFIQ